MIISDFRHVTIYDFRPALWLSCLGQAARLDWAGLGWPDEAGLGWRSGLGQAGEAAGLGKARRRRLGWAGLGWPS